MPNLVKALKSVKKIYWFVLVLLAALIVVSLYNRNVIQGFVGGSSDAEFTMYYVDWCPHCKSAKPVFNEFMGNGTVLVNGKSVRCKMVNGEQDPEATKGLNIKGYPTFILNTQGKLIEYNGPRTGDGWMSFLKENLA